MNKQQLATALDTYEARAPLVDEQECYRRSIMHGRLRDLETVGELERRVTLVYCKGHLSNDEFRRLRALALMADLKG